MPSRAVPALEFGEAAAGARRSRAGPGFRPPPGGTGTGPGCRIHSGIRRRSLCLDLRAEVLGDALGAADGKAGCGAGPTGCPSCFKTRDGGDGAASPSPAFSLQPKQTS